MFNSLRQKIARFVVERKFLRDKDISLSFNNFFESANSFIIIMPETDEAFSKSLAIPEFLKSINKNVDLIVFAPKLSLIQENHKYRSYTYGINEKTKLNLPNSKFLAEVKSRVYDIVIDLNLVGDEFSGAITNAVKANYRIGFQSEKNEKLYNIQIKNMSKDPSTAYKNLLDALKMF